VLVELGVVEQRSKAVYEVLDGASVTDVARRYGVARQTVHEWLRRFADGGVGALADKSSKPDSCPHQMTPVIEAMVVSLRRDHPAWGPSRLLYELERSGVESLPGRTSVYRALIRHRLIEPGVRRRRRQDYKRWERSRPMELWQIDDHSRYCVCARLIARATARPVCDALQFALRAHGAPRQILSDNGKVFTNRFGKGPGPVLFDRICIDNGIRHLLTAPYSPTTTGKVERFHKTLRAEFFRPNEGVFATIEEAQKALDEWVRHYNAVRPHQGAGMRPPAERFALAEPRVVEVIDAKTPKERPTTVPFRPPISRRVDSAGRIRLEGSLYRAGRWLAGESVELNLADGLLEISHRAVIVATHAHIVRPGARREPYMTSSPRRMGARPATTGTSVLRVVDSSGSVCFAATTYRVGNPYRRKQVSVAIVADSVEISLDGQILRTHPIRHDRSKEFGAFSTPNGRPRSPRTTAG
jgi:transposase InsO family protein